jgi:tetratricopeptide (TPR) repeat protein
MKLSHRRKRKELAAAIARGRELGKVGRDPEQALEALEEAVQKFPESPELRLLKAAVLLSLRPHDVIAEATKAAELAPQDPGTQVRAGHLLIGRGDVEGARSCAARASEAARPDFVLRSGLRSLNGLIAARDGEDDLAEECLRLAMSEDPIYSNFAVDLAKFLAARDRQEEALEVIDAALQIATDKKDLEQLRDRILTLPP